MTRTSLLVTCLATLFSRPVWAQHAHGRSAEQLGRVVFPISCNPDAQQHFSRARGRHGLCTAPLRRISGADAVWRRRSCGDCAGPRGGALGYRPLQEFLDPPGCDALGDHPPTIVRVGGPSAVRQQQPNDPRLLLFRTGRSRAPAPRGLHRQVQRSGATLVLATWIRAVGQQHTDRRRAACAHRSMQRCHAALICGIGVSARA